MYSGYGGFVALFVAIAGIVFYFIAVVAWAILQVVGYALVYLLGALYLWLREAEVAQRIGKFYSDHYVSFAIAVAWAIILIVTAQTADMAAVLMVAGAYTLIILTICLSKVAHGVVRL